MLIYIKKEEIQKKSGSQQVNTFSKVKRFANNVVIIPLNSSFFLYAIEFILIIWYNITTKGGNLWLIKN